MLPTVLIIFSFLLISSSFASDLCVADLEGPKTPFGYACKRLSDVTVDDFVLTGFGKADNLTFEDIKASATRAYVQQFPGLNSLGISAAKIHIAVGGLLPLHTHPDASEMLFVTEGTIGSGFIATDNTVYYKTLKKGDTMVVPRGLLHFQVNEGDEMAAVIESFNSDNPGLQLTRLALFGNDMPTALLQKVSFLDKLQIMKLKALFGGTG